ncbi:uncharacterized protein LOC114937531 [Nylanderia fulva]|uniref:uncharacterized protein LOC114937531 n=1 Tax=Nylanderia fulva TaxID=613905 RepID=UPI0010FB09C8|nr:uncharacterized protein LOC114937531 [Nylanderia fulva]
MKLKVESSAKCPGFKSKMSEISADSTVEEDDEERKDCRLRRIAKVLFCCFRRDDRSNSKRIVEYDPEEYDYIVEKLVVKRVPLALFAIPADLSQMSKSVNRRGRPGDDASTTPDDISQSSSLSASTFSGNRSTANVIVQGTCLASSTKVDRTGLDRQIKVKKQGILSRFSALHADLRKDRPTRKSSNFSENKQSFTKDISMASSTRTDISSRTSASSMVVQDNVSTRDNSRHESAFESERNDKSRGKKEDFLRQSWNLSTEKDQEKFGLGRNRRYIVSPFRVRRGSLDLTKPKNITGNFGVDGKSLAYIQESLEDKSLESAEDSKDRNLQSNPAVRWRITIKRRRANADSESRSPEREMHR